MRVQFIIPFLASSLLVIASPVGDPAQPDVIATAVFPADNQLGRITNGKSNKLQVGIENKSAQNITITSIGGSLHHPETGKLYKNTSTLTYGIPLLHGAKISLPYNFYSEFSTGERRLDVWVNHASPDGKFRVPAYSSVVTIVEGSSSWKEPATLFTLLLGLGLLGGIGYAVQQALTPEKKVKKAKVSEPIVVTASGAGGYQEEWIPEGHLGKSKSGKRGGKKGGAVTSGDEVTSGAESGAEKRRRK